VVIFSCEKFRPYITDTKVIFYTDRQAIKEVLGNKDTKPRWMSWSLLLQEFDSEILDRKEIDDALVNVSLLKEKEEYQGTGICIPYGTVEALDKATTRTFGDTEPPFVGLEESFLKLRVREEILIYLNVLILCIQANLENVHLHHFVLEEKRNLARRCI
jgi:hypothetical protein